MVALWRWTRSAGGRLLAGLVLGCGLAGIAGLGPAVAAEATQSGSMFDTFLSIFSSGDAGASTLPSGNSRENPLYPYAGSATAPAVSESGVYRTVCVRLCDGFYWPVSSATEMMHFQRDRNICESSCEQPARLYYEHGKDTDAAKLVSLDGKPYSALPKAYSYRKSLEPDCRCRPQPWSPSEIERHRQYGATPDPAARVEADTSSSARADSARDSDQAPVADTDVQAGNPAAEALANDPSFEAGAGQWSGAQDPFGKAAMRALKAGSNLDDDAFGSDIFTVGPAASRPAGN